jgi:hypothetical protein
MNSVVGLVITGRDKHWSVTAKITIIIIGIFTGNISVLYLLYTWFLGKIKATKDSQLAKRKEPTNDI